MTSEVVGTTKSYNRDVSKKGKSRDRSKIAPTSFMSQFSSMVQVYYVDLNQAHLLVDIPVEKRYGYVKQALAGARAIGLKTMMDLVNYVCMTLIYKERWASDRQIAEVLARVKHGDLKFSDAIPMLP